MNTQQLVLQKNSKQPCEKMKAQKHVKIISALLLFDIENKAKQSEKSLFKLLKHKIIRFVQNNGLNVIYPA